MRKFWAMVRVFLKIIMGQAFSMKVGGRENKWTGPLVWGLVLLALLPMLWLMYYMIDNIFAFFAAANHLHLAVGMTLNIGALIIFILSLMAAPAIFYFSKDVEYLLPVPVRPAQIIGAKFAVALIFEYILAVALSVVMFAALWGHLGAGALTVHMVLVALTLPILPLVYSTVVIMFLMRFVRFIRNPDRYNWIIGLLGLGFALVFVAFSQNMLVPDEQELLNLLMGEPAAMAALNTVFLTNSFAARAIGNGDWVFQLANLGVAAAGLAVFFALAHVLYLKGVLGLSESGTSGKKMTREDIIAGTVGQGAFRSYVMKEIKVLFRSPTAFMNCVLMVLFMPIVLALSFVPIFTAGSDTGIIDMLRMIDLTEPRTAAIALVAMMVLSLTMSGAATITACAISREGRNFFVMKYLPVRYSTQLNAKAACGLVVIGAGLLLVFIPLIILFRPPVWLAVAGILVAIPGAIFLNYLGLFFDLLKPKLEWDNEAEAIKQNMNIMLMLFGGMAAAVGVGFVGWFWLHTPLVAFIVLFGAGLALTALALYLALVRGKELLRQLY